MEEDVIIRRLSRFLESPRMMRHNRPLPNRSCKNEGDRALFEGRASYVYDCTAGLAGLGWRLSSVDV